MSHTATDPPGTGSAEPDLTAAQTIAGEYQLDTTVFTAIKENDLVDAIQSHEAVGDVVARQPALARVFEEAGIDYCCGGKKTLREACREKELDLRSFILSLAESNSLPRGAAEVDAGKMTLTQLVDHIEQTHHAYLRSELPRLDSLTEKVVSAHGGTDPRLASVRATLLALAEELSSHMVKEEQILFPIVRQLDGSDTLPEFHCGSLANPIDQMEAEHDQAGSALAELRQLTDGYAAPDGACSTYRALLDALAELERNMHQHVHKENNIVFPRALALEEQFESAAQ